MSKELKKDWLPKLQAQGLSAGTQRGVPAENQNCFGGQPVKSHIAGAPIRAGVASPLRVATGGEASWCSTALAAARPPESTARVQWWITRRPRAPIGVSDRTKSLTHFGQFFMANTQALLGSDNCPIWIGIGVRLFSESVSAFAGIRSLQHHSCLRRSVAVIFRSIRGRNSQTPFTLNLTRQRPVAETNERNTDVKRRSRVAHPRRSTATGHRRNQASQARGGQGTESNSRLRFGNASRR
jgi:hypothetical protein